MIDLNETLATAVTIAQAAGALLMEGFLQDKTIDHKSSDVDLVTKYDHAAEALIASRLHAAFPDHGLLGEEGTNSDPNARYAWHIDPLDGTNNYAHNFPVFCVSLGLYESTTPLLAVVYNPVLDECFTAIAGQGAHVTTASGQRPLQVSQQTTLQASLLATGFPYDRQTSPANNLNFVAEFLPRSLGLRRAGSAAMDMAYIAAGRLDGYWEQKLHSWDMAAGILLVQEAGGTVTHMDGAPIALRHQQQLHVLASNGHIHDDMLAVIAATPPPAPAP